jgi:hypothetical protein
MAGRVLTAALRHERTLGERRKHDIQQVDQGLISGRTARSLSTHSGPGVVRAWYRLLDSRLSERQRHDG